MKYLILFSILFVFIVGKSQENDSIMVSEIFKSAITSPTIMDNLKYQCNNTPGRLLGSDNSIKALNYFKEKIEALHPDACYLQEYETHIWIHHSTKASIIIDGKESPLHALALGPSVKTPAKGMQSEIIIVSNLDEIHTLGRKKIEGKIVFINQVMSNQDLSMSTSYRVDVKIRALGAIEASKYGTIATLIRSVTTRIDTFPHVGKTLYADTLPKIPIAAISTVDADFIAQQVNNRKSIQAKLSIDSETKENVKTYNLIVDLKGSEKPDEYILLGAHIDSWYNTPGAHDDGAGCAQVADAIRIFKEMNYRNKHSFRFVLFMDEELFQSGAESYAAQTEKMKWNHIAAIETDAGGFAPRAINYDANIKVRDKLNSFLPVLEPYGLYKFTKGDADVDVDRLKKFNTPVMGYKPLANNYFDFHHCGFDTFDKVNFRDLQFSTTTLTGLMYLIDKYGIQ